LSQVLRLLWQRYGRWDAGYREDDLLAIFTEQAEDLSTLLPHWLRSTEDPDIKAYLADVGLELHAELAALPSPGWQLDQSPDGGPRLKTVARQGAAETAGLEVGDELLALQRQRVRRVADVEALLGRCPQAPEASPLPLLFCRQGLVRETTLLLGPPAIQRWRLQAQPQASPAAVERRRQWLELVP
jgi:predicted metalloprotease with PDZ domain